MTSTASAPAGAQRLTFPLSPEYYKGWTAARAIAEIVANAWDEAPDFTFEWAGGVLTIEDQAAGIGNHGLLIGLSRKTDTQVGQFGEGLNASCLVLSRDRTVGQMHVETVGYSFTPTIVRHRLVAVADDGSQPPELLALDIEPNDRVRGTKVTIKCSRQLAESVRSRFRFLTTTGYQPPGLNGTVLDEPGGRLYIGGVLVNTNPKLTFSYDFSLAAAKRFQNRDRTVLDATALDRLIHQALSALDAETLVAKWVEAALHGSLHRSEQCFSSQPSPGQRKALRAVAKRLFAGHKVTWTDGQADEEAVLDLRDRGYTILDPKSLPGYARHNFFSGLGVKPARTIARKRPAGQKTTWTKRSALTDAERANLEGAIAIIRGVYGPDAVGQCEAYEQTRIDGADHDLRWGGFYEPTTTGRIGIQRENLHNLTDTLTVVAHEAAHRLRHRSPEGAYDFQDRTRGFESQLVTMATDALLLAHGAGAIPDADTVASEQHAADAAKAQKDADHPARLMRMVIAAALDRTGLPQQELADECGVSAGTLRQLRNGKYRSWGGKRRSDGAPQLRRTQAVCDRLGLDWAAVQLAVLSENLWDEPFAWGEDGRLCYPCFARRGGNSHTMGQGRVRGTRGDEMQACIDRLTDRGVDRGLIAELQGQLDHYFDGSDGSFLDAYRTLVPYANADERG